MVERLKKIFRAKEGEFFPGQERGEKVIFFTRRHPLSFLGFVVFTILMLLIPLFVYLLIRNTAFIELNEFGRRLFVVIGSAYLLFVLGFFLVGWIDYYLDIVIVTDSRIVDINQDRLFARSIADANLADVEDVNAEVKGILNTIFHFGTVYVQTAGTATNFEFRYIPHPYKTAKMIADLHQKAVEEAEMREAAEIGETIVEREAESKNEETKIDRTQIDEEKKEEKEEAPPEESPQYRRGVGILRDKRKERLEKEKKETKQRNNYQEGAGWPEMEKRAKEEKEKDKKLSGENGQKDKGAVNHKDLEKGGEVDL